jgi:hypothetical protein
VPDRWLPERLRPLFAALNRMAGHSAGYLVRSCCESERNARARRSVFATARTLNKMGLPEEAKQRVIRVTSAQQAAGPVAVLTAATERAPGAEAWFVEGLDPWLKESGKMSEV